MNLTIEKIKAYLESPEKCPFCGSVDTRITQILWRTGNTVAIQDEKCCYCDKSWREYFALHEIQELDEDGCAIPNKESP